MMYSNGPQLHWDTNSNNSNSNSNRGMAPRMRVNNRTALRYNYYSSLYDNYYHDHNLSLLDL